MLVKTNVKSFHKVSLIIYLKFLFTAAGNGHVEALQWLVEKGADCKYNLYWVVNCRITTALCYNPPARTCTQYRLIMT
jgi:hypothetical protein